MDDTVIMIKNPQNLAKKSTSNAFNKSQKTFENNFFLSPVNPKLNDLRTPDRMKKLAAYFYFMFLTLYSDKLLNHLISLAIICLKGFTVILGCLYVAILGLCFFNS
jgi:hypothetical protein